MSGTGGVGPVVQDRPASSARSRQRERARRLAPVVWLVLQAACGSDPAPAEPEEPGPAGESGWTLLAAAPISPTAARHDDVFFLDPERGWLVNTRGQVYRTENGGGTWTLAHQQVGTFYRSVGFATADRGWVGNLNFTNNPVPRNALFETVDGGVTWTNLSDRISGAQPVGICGLFVLDAQTVFAVGRWSGPAVFVRTRDGGATWQGVDLAPLATGLIDVHFFDRDEGIVVGGLGVGNSVAAQESSRTVILATHDGGETWETRYTSTRRGKWAWKISFPSRQVGYVSTQGTTNDGVILKTVDGGATWTEIEAGPGHGFSGIGFISERAGWVAADTIAFATRDGGASWERVHIGANVNRFRILSPSLGFAAGDGVYRYQPSSN